MPFTSKVEVRFTAAEKRRLEGISESARLPQSEVMRVAFELLERERAAGRLRLGVEILDLTQEEADEAVAAVGT